jgi:hypothetical protein
MKSGLLLTLKELIKLGVIKIKKKRRKRGLSTTKKSIQAQLPPVQQSMGQQKYDAFVTTSAPNPQAYSDALRLRDENRNFDTRLLEYKNQQQQQKLLLDNQQQLQQRLQQDQQQQQLEQQRLQQIQDQQEQYIITQGIPAVQNLLARTSAIEAQRASKGFVEDDNVDVIKVNGSDDFKTQQDIADPELREMPQAPQSRQPLTPLQQPGMSSDEMYQDINQSIEKALTPKPPQQLLKYSSENEYEDIPEKQTTPVPSGKKYITKKIKSQIEEKMRIYPNLSKEQARELVLLETKAVPKKKKRPKKLLTDEDEEFGLTPEQFI